MPQSFIDPASRLFQLLDDVEPVFRARFLAAVAQLGAQFPLSGLAEQIAAGDFTAALQMAEAGAKRVSAISHAIFMQAGEQTANFIGTKIGAVFDFDAANQRAIAYLQATSLRSVREFVAQQVSATRLALEDGVRRGLNPRAQARLFRDSIGLTERQQQAVLNYRRLLEERDVGALSRSLRDRRFDRTVRAAVDGRKILSRTQVDTMVSRYRERYVRFRAETIARTESLQAVHAGSQEAYAQAQDEGRVGAVRQTWVPARDGRVRDSHESMRGQVQEFGQPFLSGAGNLLRYPGDPDAPAADIVQCRCALASRAEVA